MARTRKAYFYRGYDLILRRDGRWEVWAQEDKLEVVATEGEAKALVDGYHNAR